MIGNNGVNNNSVSNNGVSGAGSGKANIKGYYRANRGTNIRPGNKPMGAVRRPFRAAVSQEVYLSVVVPAYNEEKRLPQTLIAIGDYLKRQPYAYEIIAVNDGSKDGTAAAVEALIGKVAKLKLIDNRVNRGKGYVVRQGLLAAKGQIRLFTDSDNSTPINEVEKLLPFFKQGYDLVIGSRDAKGAKLEPPQPIYRRFLGEGFGLLSNIITGTWGIEDTQCGFKAMSAAAVKEVIPRCRIDRFAFDPEILAAAKICKYRIKEVGILWKNDTRGTIKVKSLIKTIISMFAGLLTIRINLIKGVYGTKK